MYTKKFWLRTLERMIRAFFIVFLPVLTLPNVSTGVGVDVRHVGWLDALSMGAGGMVVSLALSIIGSRTGNPESPSILSESIDT